MVFKTKSSEVYDKAMYIADAEKNFTDVRNILLDNDIGINSNMHVKGSTINKLGIYYKGEKVAEVGYSIEDGEYSKLTIYKENGWKEKLDDVYKSTRLIVKNRAKERNLDPNGLLVLDYKKVFKNRTKEAEMRLTGSVKDLFTESVEVYNAAYKFGDIKEALDKKRIDLIYNASNSMKNIHVDIYHNGRLAARVGKYELVGDSRKKLGAVVYRDDGWQQDLYEIYSKSKELEEQSNQKSELRGA